MQSVPMTPILNGSDPLTELTRNLDDRLRADAYRQRGPSPWHVSFLVTSPINTVVSLVRLCLFGMLCLCYHVMSSRAHVMQSHLI